MGANFLKAKILSSAAIVGASAHVERKKMYVYPSHSGFIRSEKINKSKHKNQMLTMKEMLKRLNQLLAETTDEEYAINFTHHEEPKIQFPIELEKTISLDIAGNAAFSIGLKNYKYRRDNTIERGMGVDSITSCKEVSYFNLMTSKEYDSLLEKTDARNKIHEYPENITEPLDLSMIFELAKNYTKACDEVDAHTISKDTSTAQDLQNGIKACEDKIHRLMPQIKNK